MSGDEASRRPVRDVERVAEAIHRALDLDGLIDTDTGGRSVLVAGWVDLMDVARAALEAVAEIQAKPNT